MYNELLLYSALGLALGLAWSLYTRLRKYRHERDHAVGILFNIMPVVDGASKRLRDTYRPAIEESRKLIEEQVRGRGD